MNFDSIESIGFRISKSGLLDLDQHLSSKMLLFWSYFIEDLRNNLNNSARVLCSSSEEGLERVALAPSFA